MFLVRSRNTGPVSVLQCAPSRASSGSVNPYVDILVAALPSTFATHFFGWRIALLGKYDIVHIHWPELVARVPEVGMRGVAKKVGLLLFLARLKFGRSVVVRTVHNESPHEPIYRVWDRWYVKQLDALTKAWIVMNSATRTPDPDRTSLVRHPHYRTWYGATEVARENGSLLYFGLVREYKNVPGLIRAFSGLSTQLVGELVIAGRVKEDDLRQQIESAALRDFRLKLRLDFQSDEELATLIGRSEIVVLPYARMHNSGALLLALSLGRQVIAPNGAVVQELQDEVGRQWVLSYEGDLSPEKLSDLVREARRVRTATQPSMSARDPSAVAAATANVYMEAIHARA